MELIKGALEMLKGYCEKHSACKNGCVFYDSEKGCIFQIGRASCRERVF